ncbi:MAG: hypothetical protein LUQ71_10390 [Methanoregula sp.]|nr:hypothetical protein [Methanoregula sp.]
MEHQRNLSAKIRKSDDELMAELSAGVQKIFADAVKDTPLQRVETEKVSPLDQTTCFENCCVTQHNTTSTVLSLRKEGRKEKSAGLEAVGGV